VVCCTGGFDAAVLIFGWRLIYLAEIPPLEIAITNETLGRAVLEAFRGVIGERPAGRLHGIVLSVFPLLEAVVDNLHRGHRCLD
jgi:hypothetical protein